MEVALSVRKSATEVMAGLAEELFGGEQRAAAPDSPHNALVDELVSAGAALAINCVTSLEKYLAAAKRLGASDRKIRAALGVARTVKKMAGQKVEEAATSYITPAGAAQVEAGDGSGGCSSSETDGK